MPRLQRRWWILKWAGLVLSLLIVVVWLLSLHWSLDYSSAMGRSGFLQMGITEGSLYRIRLGDDQPSWDGQWSISRNSALPELVELVPRWYSGGMIFPLWIPLLIVAIPTVFLWRRGRRRPPGHCQNCGYNLTGNVSGVCPECGEKIQADEVNKGGPNNGSQA
jgi:hypothetical protein